VKIKIIYRKLGKEQAYGISSSDGVIEIDERLRGKKAMEILIHEVMHLTNPKDDEKTIIRKSIILTKVLWQEGYRKIDDTIDLPLQDGSI
jgi:hypothetical protein